METKKEIAVKSLIEQTEKYRLWKHNHVFDENTFDIIELQKAIKEVLDTFIENIDVDKYPVHEKLINNLRDLCYTQSLEAGWHTDLETGELLERNKGEMIALIHSEVTEALEGERKGLMDDHLPHRPMAEVEMADAIIRILDSCGRWGYDVGGAIIEKLAYNKNRADHKIENRQKGNGKKF